MNGFLRLIDGKNGYASRQKTFAHGMLGKGMTTDIK